MRAATSSHSGQVRPQGQAKWLKLVLGRPSSSLNTANEVAMSSLTDAVSCRPIDHREWVWVCDWNSSTPSVANDRAADHERCSLSATGCDGQRLVIKKAVALNPCSRSAGATEVSRSAYPSSKVIMTALSARPDIEEAPDNICVSSRGRNVR